MEKDRERRYQSAKAILNDLRNIEEGLPLGTKIRPGQETFIATLVRKKLLLPTLAVAIAIITVIVWQFLPQKVAQKPQEKPSLAVVYFENNTGDESLDYWRKALSELLIADLSQSKYIKVLSGDRLFKILEDLNQLEVKSYSSDVLEKIADEEGIENILRGNFAKAGDIFRINVMLQNPSTGEIIGSEKEEGKGEESMFIMVDELTRRIKAHFQLSAGEIADDIDEEVRKITTGSSEAYKHYSKGLQHYRKAAYRQCIEFMNKAIEIDPEFAMAYRTMAYAYGTLGYAAEQRKYLQRALESKDRISERERYLIQGDFYRHSEETAGLAIDAYTRLLELYPEEWRGSINLGILYHDLEQWDKARIKSSKI
ncbi:MAG: hypothetical protein KAW19_10990, partial [Candidatus Aminicenantes bacterium]|nr:hypothetical protein [Candidatus Aminicenantes bacterium]